MHKMPVNSQKNSFLLFVLLFGTLTVATAVDQFCKYKVRHHGGLYICNTGISFGLTIAPIFFWLITGTLFLLGIFCLSLVLDKKLLSTPFCLGFALFAAGALSNGLDRLFFGCVFDYIFPFWKSLPAFNFADIAIFLGSCLIIYTLSSEKYSLFVHKV